MRGSSEIWALSSGCKNLHGAWARAQLYPGTAAHAGTDRAAHVAAQRRAGCWQLLLGIWGERPPRTPLPSTGTLGTAPPQWITAWKWHSADTPMGAAAGAAPWAHRDGRGTTGVLRTGGTTRVPCRGCTAMGAPPWVHSGACNAGGALQWLHHHGCAAAVPCARGRLRCRGRTPLPQPDPPHTHTHPLGAQGSPPSRAQPKIRQGRGAQRSSLQKTPPAASAVPCRSPAPGGEPSTAPTSNSSLWRGAGAGAQREDASPRAKPRLKNGNMGAQMKSCLLWKKSH